MRGTKVVKVIFYTKMMDIYDTWRVNEYNSDVRKKILDYMRENEAIKLAEVREIKIVDELMRYQIPEEVIKK